MPRLVSFADRPRWHRRRGLRPSPRHDATPFVDLAFVLLAAYVLVMLLGQPAEMEVNLPEYETDSWAIAEPRVIYLRATSDGAFWWNYNDDSPRQLTLAALHDSLRSKTQDGKTVTVLKVERGAPYSTAVDLLDDFDRLNVERFAIARMQPRDLDLIAEARASR